MAGPGLPTSITAGVTSTHAPDSQLVNQIVNQFDTTLSAATAGHTIVTDGTTFDNRALLSTDLPGMVVNTRTASYTLVLTDAGKRVEMNVASANTLTVPPNSSVAFPVGTVVLIRQYGAGVTTITPGSGVTIRSRGGLLATAGTYAEASIEKRATDEWVASGDLA